MTSETNGQAMPRQEITDWLISWIAKELGMPAQEIDPGQSLLQYSMSSLTATILVGDLEDWLDLRLPPSLVWDYTSIDAMTDYLAEQVASKRTKIVSGETSAGSTPSTELKQDARQLLDKIDQLSDQEVDALLKRFNSSDRAPA